MVGGTAVYSPNVKKYVLALLTGVLAWTTAAGFLHWGSLVALALIAAFIAIMQQRAGSAGRQGLAAGMLSAAAFVVLQGWTSHQGKLQVAEHLERIGASSRLLDTALTPFPANPMCWSFVSVERNDGARTYRVRRGMLSVAPALMPLSACPAALSPKLVNASPSIGLEMESETSLATLRSLAGNCHFRAWMRFARAPVLEAGVASDARFARGGTNFSRFDSASFDNVPCASGVPQWGLPRQDLLDAAP